MPKTLLKIKRDTTWEILDIYDDIPISANKSAADLTDLSSSSLEYTKTFTIPATKHNHNIFNNFFSVVGIDFNPLAKVDCVVERASSIIFEGYLRLNAVIINDDKMEYEVYILTALSDLSSELQNLNINDLNYNDLNHENTYDNITLSWGYSGGTSGLFNGQILYPLINYGYDYSNGGTPPFTIATSGATAFTGSSNPVTTEYFKPAIQVKSVFDRIFSATSYTYESEFLNTDYFKSIYMSCANNGELGIITNSEAGNQNKFKVYASSFIAYPFDEDDPRKPLVFNTLDPDGYDPLGLYTLDDDFPNSSNDDFNNYFNVPIAGDYFFNLQFAYTNNTGQNFPSYFKIKAYKSTSPFNIDQTGTVFYETSGSGFPALGTLTNANILFSGTLASDEYVGVYIEPVTSIGFPELGVRIYGYDGVGNMWMDLYESPTLLGTSQVVMKQQIPSINANAFVKAIFDKFNLVVEKDEVNQVINIEPFNYRFDNDNRNTKDYTQKLDYNSAVRIETLDFDLDKEIELTYNEERNERLNEYYLNNTKKIFGRALYRSNSIILTGKQTIQIPFAPTPTEAITGSDYIIVPATYERVELDNGTIQLQPAQTQPHLFFWVGNRYMYNNTLGTAATQWYVQSGLTSVEWTTYPCVSHLSHLTSGDTSTFSDLNFSYNWDFFEADNDVINPVSFYTVYNTFWKDYLDSIYSNEARRLRGRFLLTPQDYNDLKLNDRVYIKDNFWRLEEVTDADLVNESLIQCSFIKDLNNIEYIVPPAPTWDIPPNAPN